MLDIFWPFVTPKNIAKTRLSVMMVVATPKRLVLKVTVFEATIRFVYTPNTCW